MGLRSIGNTIKNQVKEAWRYYFIQIRENSYEVDADILMNPRVWEASGHLAGFSDPLLDCKECKTRHRADNLIQDYDQSVNADAMSQEEMITFIRENHVPCPACEKSNYTDIRQFNLMFETKKGVTDDSSSQIFLRPENAQEFVLELLSSASRGREYPFGYSRPACWDTQTSETHLAVRLKFVAKSRFHLLVPRWYFVVTHYIGCEESRGLTCDEISGYFEIDVEMYEKQVLPAEKKKQPGHGAVINSLTAVCSGYFH